MKKDGPRGFVWFPQDYFGDVLLRLMPGDLRIFWVEALFLMAESPRRGVLLQKNGKPYSSADLATAMNLSQETVDRAHQYVLEKGIASLDRQSRALMNRKMVRTEMQRKVNEKNAKLGGNPALKPKTQATSALPLIDTNIKNLSVSDNHSDKWPDNLSDNSRARVPDPDPEPDPVLPRPVHNSLNIDLVPRKKRGGPTDPPKEFEITEAMWTWAADNGFSPDLVRKETPKMLDQFRSKGERRSDWPATWRNWLRNTEKYGHNGNGSRVSPQRPTDDEVEAERFKVWGPRK